MPTIQDGMRPTGLVPRSGYITVQSLADRLGTDTGQIHALIVYGYLKLLTKASTLGMCEVALPPASILDWLKGMLAPIQMRPMITLEELGELASMSVGDVRRLCVLYMVPISIDPCFGELLSISAAQSFFRNLHAYHSPAHFDRVHLLLWMFGMDKDKLKRDPPAFDERLEAEIARISKLAEPERTMRGVELLNRFVDAKRIAEVTGITLPKRAGKIESRLRRVAGVPSL